MEKSSKFLTESLVEVDTPFQLDSFMAKHKGLDSISDLYIDPRRMMLDVLMHRRVDVLTYSFSECPLAMSGVLRRVVVGLKLSRWMENWMAGKDFRFLEGLHTKLFLGLDRRGNPKAAYIGSQNLVKPTTLNIGIRVSNRKTVQRLAEYFEAIWTLAKPL